MQTLFQSSEEAPENEKTMTGLGVVPGHVIKFDETQMKVPHIGWNGRIHHQDSPVFKYVNEDEKVYFVHSYFAPIVDSNKDWTLTSTTYAGQNYISAVQKGYIVACQFHPEKVSNFENHDLRKLIFILSLSKTFFLIILTSIASSTYSFKYLLYFIGVFIHLEWRNWSKCSKGISRGEIMFVRIDLIVLIQTLILTEESLTNYNC